MELIPGSAQRLGHAVSNGEFTKRRESGPNSKRQCTVEPVAGRGPGLAPCARVRSPGCPGRNLRPRCGGTGTCPCMRGCGYDAFTAVCDVNISEEVERAVAKPESGRRRGIAELLRESAARPGRKPCSTCSSEICRRKNQRPVSRLPAQTSPQRSDVFACNLRCAIFHVG